MAALRVTHVTMHFRLHNVHKAIISPRVVFSNHETSPSQLLSTLAYKYKAAPRKSGTHNTPQNLVSFALSDLSVRVFTSIPPSAVEILLQPYINQVKAALVSQLCSELPVSRLQLPTSK